MLLLAFCLSFCSFGVGVAYADDVAISLSVPAMTFTRSDNSTKVTTKYVSSTSASSAVVDYFASILSEVGFFNSRISFTPQDIVKYDSNEFHFEYSKSGLQLTDLSVDIPFDFAFVSLEGYAVPKIHSTYRVFYPDFYFVGSASVTFSDGSTKSIPLRMESVNSRSISFSAKKELFGNEYIMTSEDFNLKSNSDSQFTLSADGSARLASSVSSLSSEMVSISAQLASISGGQFSGRGVPNSVTLHTMNNMYPIPGTGAIVPPTITVPVVQSADFSSASFLNSSINGSFSASVANLVAASADFAATSADFALESADIVLTQGIVEPSLVKLDKASSDVYVTGFKVSGTIYLPGRYLDFEGPFDFDPYNTENFNSQSYFLFAYNAFCTYGESESILAHIAGTLDNIHHVLRYELPLSIRHLLIPTTEEVSDVVEEAVEDIKNNAGGLGQAVGAVEEDIKAFTSFLTSEVTGSFYIPAAVVNVNNQSYKLWDNFDVAPYFKAAPVQAMTSYLVPFLEFLVATALIYHLYYMWISILSGASYFAFLKGIKTLYDSEDD